MCPECWVCVDLDATVFAEGEEEDPFKKASLVTTVPSRFNVHISYNHSFGMSEEHFVILEQPITINVLKVATNNWRREGFASNFVQFPEENVRMLPV